MLDSLLSSYVPDFRRAKIPAEVLDEAAKRVLDGVGCFYGAFDAKPARILRETLTAGAAGQSRLWGTARSVPPEIAALANGSCVRALDYNDTYLSLEPCHPSDLLASVWAAAELSGARRPGETLLRGLILGYEVMCRLCDATSLRLRGWDHVTYLPIASAVACSYVLGLNEDQTRNAVALAVTANNALRQTRVGTISDWKAACAAYAARSGLLASRLAKAGFTGPREIFEGKNGFFAQVSGTFSMKSLGADRRWAIMRTHTKFFPAEHHAQSAIEAALALRGLVRPADVREITIECFDVAVDIIGSEEEKWRPSTRETADHSMPYLVAVALLDGDVTLAQYARKRFLDADVRALLRRTRVRSSKKYSSIYPAWMPTRLIVRMKDGEIYDHEILRPKGYAGRPMSRADVEAKFRRLASRWLPEARMKRVIETVRSLPKAASLSPLAAALVIHS